MSSDQPIQRAGAFRRAPSRRTHRGLGSMVAMLVVLWLPVTAAQARSSGPRHMPPASGVTTRLPVSLGATTCASNWIAPGPGSTRLSVLNTGTTSAVLRLQRAGTGRTVVTLRVGAHRHAGGTFLLRPGAYQFECVLSTGVIVQSNVAHVTLDPIPGTPSAPLGPGATGKALAPIIAEFRRDTTAQLTVAAADLTMLESQIGTGSISGAESAWTTAYLAWERLGAFYGQLGNPGAPVTEIPGSLPGGPDDLQFTGFYRIEVDLWQRQDLTAAGRDTGALEALVTQLADGFASDPIAPIDLPTRTHEILEDALRDLLSGNDDFGSGTELAAVLAGVQATRQLVDLEAPLLVNRVPGLTHQATTRLDGIDGVIDRLSAATEGATSPPPLAELSLGQREQLDAAVSSAVETLAQYPAALRLGGSGGDAT